MDASNDKFVQEETYKDLIYQIIQIDPLNPELNYNELRDVFFDAQKLLRYVKDKISLSSTNEFNKAIIKEEDDSSLSSNNSKEYIQLNELKASISKKNLYIKEILIDIKAYEEENAELKNQIRNLKKNLSDTTTHIQNFNIYFKNIQSENIKQTEKIDELEQAQLALHVQLSEVNDVNKNQENQIEDFIEQMNMKLSDWKDILSLKDYRIKILNDIIIDLREKLSVYEKKDPDLIEQIIKDRDRQINDLKVLLSEATKNIEDVINKNQKLKKDMMNYESGNIINMVSTEIVHENDDIMNMKKTLQKYHSRIEYLEDCLQTREKEIINIRNIDFIHQDQTPDKSHIINKIMKKMDVRDKQILSLVAENNKSNHIIHQLQSENCMMREKLNIVNDDNAFDVSYIKREKDKYDEKYDNLYQQLSCASEENILLQIRLRQKEKNIRKLYKYLSEIGIKIPQNFISIVLSESNPFQKNFEENNNEIQLERSDDKGDLTEIVDNIDIQDNESMKNDYSAMRENHQQLIDENEGLRKCFHEILDAVKSKVIDSTCDVDLPTAERLLNVLDSRHVAGWYHPAMRMLLQLNYEKGFQNSLRTMLKDARTEIASTLDLLNQEREKNLVLEKTLIENKNMTPNQNVYESDGNILDENKSKIENEKTKINNIDVNIIDKANKSYESIIRKNLKNFHCQYQLLYDSMIEVFSQYNSDKMKWISTESNYKYEIENISLLLESMKIRLNEVEKLKIPLGFSKNTDFEKNVNITINYNESSETDSKEINQIQKNFPDINEILCCLEKVDPEKFVKVKAFIESHLITIEKNNYFERKNEYIELLLKKSQSEKTGITNEFNDFKIKSLKMNKTYEIKIQRLLYEIGDLRNELKNSVPLSEFLKLNEKFSDISMKYRKCLNNDCGEFIFELSKNVIPSNCNEKIHGKNNLETLLDHDKRNWNTASDLHKKENNEKLCNHIQFLEKKNFDLQEQQNMFLNTIQTLWLKEDHQLDIQNLISLKKDKEDLEIQIIELNSKILVLEEKLTSSEKTKFLSDMEGNILKHQIVDLQSSTDDKSIIARLNTEILISHINTANMNEKEEILIKNYEDEHNNRIRLENILQEKEEEYKKYLSKINTKLSFLNSLLQTMREQYQGAIPMVSLEILKDLQYKLQNLETLRKEKNFKFFKNSVENEEEASTNKLNINTCTISDEMKCNHYILMKKIESKAELNISTLLYKLKKLEEENLELIKRLDSTNEDFLQLTFAFDKLPNENNTKNFLTDIEKLSHMSTTESSIDENLDTPIPRPRSIKSSLNVISTTADSEKHFVGRNLKSGIVSIAETQTDISIFTANATCQTDIYFGEIEHLKTSQEKFLKEKEIILCNLNQSVSLATERAAEILKLQTENSMLKYKIEHLQNALDENKEKYKSFSKENIIDKNYETIESSKNDIHIDQFKNLLENIKQIEEEKNNTIQKFKDLLSVEKSAHLDTKKVAGKQIYDLKEEMENLEKECNGVKKMLNSITNDGIREKNNSKLMELEDHCFRLQTDLDNNYSSTTLLKSECNRWKSLAIERFANMEVLRKQLESKHNDEVVSYKSEATHWLTELTTTKSELSDMKIQLNDLRASNMQQISEKNHIIENLQLSNIYLQQQLSNIFAAISEEESFDISQMGQISDQNNRSLKEQIKTVKEKNDDCLNNLNTKTQVNKIRQEKEMLSKQNTILRKQIQILTEREKRLKYEHQHMKSQIQNKVTVLNNSNKSIYGKEENMIREKKENDKISTELSINGSDAKMKYIDLWNKQKRWQEISEHWKQKYQNKCSEFEQLKRNYESSKNIIYHFEKEKRSIESRLSKHSKISDGFSPSTVTGESDSHLEMLLQDKERLENELVLLKSKLEKNVTHNSLLERLETQQRKIAAYELSEKVFEFMLYNCAYDFENALNPCVVVSRYSKGKDVIINEYENLLAQNAILSKKNLKLESEHLEKQISFENLANSTCKEKNQSCIQIQQKNEHLERYIKLLKEENNQLIAKNIEFDAKIITKSSGSVEQIKKKNDLERTILTLRGIVNKLQSENKQLKNDKIQKSSIQIPEHMIIQEMKKEKDRLNAVIKDKDELLNRAKVLLKKAADNEKQLLKQIKILRELETDKSKKEHDFSRFKDF